MEASQRYPNTIQQAITHTYMGFPYAYGIGIRPIRVRDVPYTYGTSRTRMGQYTHTGQNTYTQVTTDTKSLNSTLVCLLCTYLMVM